MYESKFRTTQPEAEIFHQYYDVVFIDPTGYYNICSNLSLDFYHRIQNDSKMALQLLNNEQVNSFRYLFATKSPLFTQIDHIVQFDAKQIYESIDKSEHFFSYCGYWRDFIGKIALSILRKGLDKRIRAIIPITDDDSQSTWNINESIGSDEKVLKFGLILNAEYALDILDKGPQSNLPEAEEYREFWGSKSELRRFQDG